MLVRNMDRRDFSKTAAEQATRRDRLGGTRPQKRTAMGMKPLAEAPKDEFSGFVRMQPEHVDIAGALGLGIANRERIDLREYSLA